MMMQTAARMGLDELLQWHLDAGVDEITGAKPVNHLVLLPSAVQKTAVKQESAQPSRAAGGPSMAPSAAIAKARELAEAASTFEELVASIQKFDGCALKKTATNTVTHDGNPASRLMVIGEAPGAEEDRQGIPFCGPSGKLLDRMLAAIGIDRTTCLITNTVYWRPPGNRQPSPEETAICEPFVRKMVALVNPALILLVGGTATKAVLGTEQGITRLRGQNFTYQTPYAKKDYSVAVTFHPSYLLRTPAQKRLAWQDMMKVKELLGK